MGNSGFDFKLGGNYGEDVVGAIYVPNFNNNTDYPTNSISIVRDGNNALFWTMMKRLTSIRSWMVFMIAFKNYWIMGNGLSAGYNKGDHLRLDKVGNQYNYSDIEDYFPFEFNLCESINNTQLSSTYCNPLSNATRINYSHQMSISIHFTFKMRIL